MSNDPRRYTPLCIAVVLLFSNSQIYNSQDSSAQESTSNATVLISSDQRISFTNYIGILAPENLSQFNFYLINNGEDAARNIRINSSSLITKEQPVLSLAPTYITPDNIKLTPSEYPSLAKDKSLLVNFKLNKIIDNEATYEGRLQVIGDNFEPVELEVEIIYKDNPWAYVIFAWIGVAVAVGIGYWYTRYTKTKEYENVIDDDTDIISHINGHIRNINLFRNTVPRSTWNDIFYKVYSEKKKSIIKYRNSLKLDENAEAVVWFHIVDDLFHTQNLLNREPLPNVNNRPLLEILKPKEDDKYYSRIKGKLIRMQVQESLRDRKKWIYVLVTSVISAFLAIFAAISFMGNPILNIAVAISLGFTTYRIQDILKAFSIQKDE